jgi:hypothetical protein
MDWQSTVGRRLRIASQLRESEALKLKSPCTIFALRLSWQGFGAAFVEPINHE